MSFSNIIEASQVPSWILPSAMPVVFSKEKNIPGSWQFYLKRHKKDPKINTVDEGSMLYHFDEESYTVSPIRHEIRCAVFDRPCAPHKPLKQNLLMKGIGL